MIALKTNYKSDKKKKCLTVCPSKIKSPFLIECGSHRGKPEHIKAYLKIIAQS